MIDRPIRYVDEFCKAGADILTIHEEADTPENTRKALEKHPRERCEGCAER